MQNVPWACVPSGDSHGRATIESLNPMACSRRNNTHRPGLIPHGNLFTPAERSTINSCRTNSAAWKRATLLRCSSPVTSQAPLLRGLSLVDPIYIICHPSSASWISVLWRNSLRIADVFWFSDIVQPCLIFPQFRKAVGIFIFSQQTTSTKCKHVTVRQLTNLSQLNFALQSFHGFSAGRCRLRTSLHLGLIYWVY